MIVVVVNGAPRTLEDGSTVEEAVALLSVTVETPGVAVAVDDAIVRRADWPTTPVHEGARIEVVRATAGG